MRFLLALILILVFPTPTPAAIQFAIDNPVVSNTEISVDVRVSDINCSNENKCYLLGGLQKGSGNYFGQTLNNQGSWVDYVSIPEQEYIKSSFFFFQPISASWSGQLKLRFSPNDSAYKGPGNYELKVRRYTGNSSSPAGDSNTLSIELNAALPTNTPGPTNTPQPSNTPTPTSTPVPTATPKPSNTPKPSPTRVVELIPTIGDAEFVNAQTDSQGRLLDLGDSPPPGESAVLGTTAQRQNNAFPIVIIVIGIIGLVISLVLLYRYARKA